MKQKDYQALYQQCMTEREKLLSQNQSVQFPELPWVGNLGQWIWDYQKNEVLFNPKKINAIGFDMDDMTDPVGFQFFTDRIHPDDYQDVMDNMARHIKGETKAYEIAYRIAHKDGHYVWFYDRGVAVERDEKGKAIKIVGIVFDISEQKKIESRLIYLSERDSLTGLYNRRVFMESLDEQIKAYKAFDQPFSVLMFDIDHFKSVNDTFGHLAGDDVLVSLAKKTSEVLRKYDICSRYGGEEFTVILPNTVLSEAIVVADRLRNAIAELKVSIDRTITVSIGVAQYHDEPLDTLIKRVDDLLYKAKDNGRNRIEYE